MGDGWIRRPGRAVLDAAVRGAADEDEATVRRAFAAGSLGVALLAPVWGALYLANGEVVAGLIPSGYAVVTAASLVALVRRGGWTWFRFSQTLLMFVLPVALMLTLGGYVLGSAVLIWAVIAPLGALWGGLSREALLWVLAFLVAAVASGLVEPLLRSTNGLPEWLRTTFFVLNIGVFMAVVVWLIDFFILQKQRVLDVMRRARALESAYLQQEVSLRQSEKLATLGRLSAGLAHELNNPTAAVQRAAGQLAGAWGPESVDAVLAGAGLDDGERSVVRAYVPRIADAVEHPPRMEPLERSDREDEVARLLGEAGVADPWPRASRLVEHGLVPADVEALGRRLRPGVLGAVLVALARFAEQASLLRTIEEGSRRITGLVGALRTYSNLDRAPVQSTDVHEGLDSTLAMLRGRLGEGIEVTRHFAADLPRVEARPGELNQVWTNIIDNAIDAMGEHGTLEVATRRPDPGHVAVDITDTGPGIPPALLPTVFDPFVTTKAPGQGTGLGLNIAHGIVTVRHGGTITVASEPGRTTFTVCLPVDGAPGPASGGA